MRLSRSQNSATTASIRTIPVAGTRPASFYPLWDSRKTDADFLRAALMQAAREVDAAAGVSDEYGDRYSIDFEISREDRHATVRSAWIVLRGETAPRLTSCFVLLD